MMDPFQKDKDKGWQKLLGPGDVIFVGEGPDDCALVRHLTAHWKPRPWTLTRSDRDPLKALGWGAQFRTLVQNAYARRAAAIGLIWDAEKNRRRAIKTLRGMFKAADLVLPKAQNCVHLQGPSGKRIKTAYLVNPAGRNSGSLESLFVPQVRESRVGECVEQLLKCYRRREPTGMASNQDKVRVRTYLAYRNPSNTGLSIALQDGLLSCDGSAFAAVTRFVGLLKPPDMPLLNGLPDPREAG